MADNPLDYRYTNHQYEPWSWLNDPAYWCLVHNQVCNPNTPITVDHILEKAATDATLPDGGFMVLADALRAAVGQPLDPDSARNT